MTNGVDFKAMAVDLRGQLLASEKLCAELLAVINGYDQPVRVAIKMLNRTGQPTAQEIGSELREILGMACTAIEKARGQS